jgi:hypothetical protein
VGHATMMICGVVLVLLAIMALLAATDPDRKRPRSSVTLDTEYNIKPVAVRPRQPATPSHGTQVISDPRLPTGYDPPTALLRPARTGGYVQSVARPEPVIPPRSPSGVSRPSYIAPVPTQSSRVHDRNHCPGCMCKR